MGFCRIENTCLISAALFLLSYLMSLGYLVGIRNNSQLVVDSTYSEYVKLDPDYIKEEWKLREDTYALSLAIGFVNLTAWVVFCVPLLMTCWILSNHGKEKTALHVSIAALGFSGCVMEAMARMIFVGAHSTSQWLATDFNLDNWTEGGGDGIGWRVLELTYTMVHGLVLWIDAIEWLFLSAVLFMLYASVRGSKRHILARGFVKFGILIGFLCFFAFTADILRLNSWREYGAIAMMCTVTAKLVLFPGWLLWLGRQLHNLQAEGIVDEPPTAEMTNRLSSAPDGEGEDGENPFIT